MLISARTILGISVVLGTALCAEAGQKSLKPVPSEGQTVTVESETHIPVVAQTLNGVYVQASIVQRGELFKAGVILVNRRSQPIAVEQEKFFALNAYDRQFYRFSDYEVRDGWARLASLPSLPPPPPA